MQAGLLPNPTLTVDELDELSAEFEIALLDGVLGAVPGAADPALTQTENLSCWCGCFVCYAPPTD